MAVRKTRANRNKGRGTTTAPPKSTTKRLVLLALFVAVVLASVFAANSRRAHRQTAANHSRNEVAGISSAKVPRTLPELIALKPGELNGTDIALMNLLCAKGLPGAESLNIDESVATLDQWAQHAKHEIDRNYHRFRADPGYFYHSEGQILRF